MQNKQFFPIYLQQYKISTKDVKKEQRMIDRKRAKKNIFTE